MGTMTEMQARIEELELENARLRADKQPALNVWEQCLMDATSKVIEANQNCSGTEPSVSLLAEAADNLIGIILDADLPDDHPIWEKWKGAFPAKQSDDHTEEVMLGDVKYKIRLADTGECFSLGNIIDAAFTRGSENELAKIDSEMAALRAKLESLPADWTTDSSLKTWFPFTADTLDKLEGENRSLRAEVEQLRSKPADRITEQDAREIIEAVAYIGVDFGYGVYELEQDKIEKARALLDKLNEGRQSEDKLGRVPSYWREDWKRNVMLMWQCVRKHDSSIPSDVLDYMRESMLAMLSASPADSEGEPK